MRSFDVFLLLSWILGAIAYPERLSCSTSLTVGTFIMAGNAVSSTSRSVVVKRGSTTLSSGDSYVAGETLTISISSTSGGANYIFEASNAAFTSGSCTNSVRSPTTKSGSLVMPSSGTVTVKVAWATQQGAVSISNLFTLNAPVATATPTKQPTAQPTTNKPTALTTAIPSTVPTIQPSLIPTTLSTSSPTVVPGETASPSFSPTPAPTTSSTFSPTPKPTVAPTASPTTISTAVPTSSTPTSTPTGWPTSAFFSLSYFTVTQRLQNVTANIFDSSNAQNAWKYAVSSCMTDVSPNDVKLFVGGSSSASRLAVAAKLQLTTTVMDTLDVSYAVYFSTAGDGTDTTYSLLKSQLETAITSSGTFQANLRDGATLYNVPVFHYAVVNTSASSFSISEATVVTTHTPAPTMSPAVSVSDDNLRRVILGVTIGVGIPIVVAVLMPFTVQQKVVGSYCMLATVLGVVILALVLAWGTNNDESADTDEALLSGTKFLGRPKLDHNPLALHPIMLVGGFYLSIVISILSPVVLGSKSATRWIRAVSYLAGIASLMVGMRAIVKMKQSAYTPALTSIHTWLGVPCIAVYAVNLVGVVVVEIMCSEAPVTTTVDVRKTRDSSAPLPVYNASSCASAQYIRLGLELMTLGFATLCILTGITSQVGQCNYVNVPNGSDPNSAAHYPQLPTACKIAFGLGIAVALTSLLTATVAVNQRKWTVMTKVKPRSVIE